MIKCPQFWKALKRKHLVFFTGVPDSTFKELINFLNDKRNKDLKNIIACNECEAVAIAAGYHLATGNTGIVYMQNSGEGKTVNPLTSLCDSSIYSIPVLLLIGWRGEPGQKDEPQHKKMGEITLSLLDVLGIPYETVSEDNYEEAINKSVAYMETKKSPYALIIRKSLFEKYNLEDPAKNDFEISREEAIKIIMDRMDGSEVVVSTTGKISRELFEYRVSKGQKPTDFYTVGSMGCSTSVAHSIAIQKPKKRVLILDGDGAAIMQLGALATVGHYKPKNFYHIILDNESHDSTGGQPTVSSTTKLDQVALSCGYKTAIKITNKKDLLKCLNQLKSLDCPAMLLIKVKKGSRENLGRPITTPVENKQSFMEFLSK